MALEFNITADDMFFLGEDKVIDFQIFALNGTTPLDVSGLPMEWNLRKTDKADDPALITRGEGTGLTVIGDYSATPSFNTQRVRLIFVPADTNPLVTALASPSYVLKAGFPYRHSLKRKDTGNNNVLSFGSFVFRQATER